MLVTLVDGIEFVGPFSYYAVRSELNKFGRVAGIYLIEDMESTIIYAGSSDFLTRRFGEHLYLLRKNDHPKSRLQDVFNSGKKLLFYFKICGTREEAFSLEQRLIDHLLNDPKFINVAIDSEKPWVRKENYTNPLKGRSHPEEFKRRLSEITKDGFLKGRKNPMLNRNHSRETKDKISKKLLGRQWSELEHKTRPKTHVGKKVLIDGVEYNSIVAAAIALNIKYNTVYWRVMTNKPEYSNWCLIR